jgi:hypothetical protein
VPLGDLSVPVIPEFVDESSYQNFTLLKKKLKYKALERKL